MKSIHPIQSLYNHRSRSTAAVADRSYSILTGLQLVEQGDEDTRAWAAQGVAERDGASKHVDFGVLQTENLYELDLISS